MKRFLAVLALVAGGLVCAPAPVAALTYPTPFSYFPVCSTK